MAKQNTAPPAPQPTMAPSNPLSVLGAQNAVPQQQQQPVVTSVDQAPQQLPPTTAPPAGVNPYMFGALGGLAQNPAALMQAQSQNQTPAPLAAAPTPATPTNPLAALLPQATAPPALPAPTITPDALQQQLQLLQLLAAQGIPQEQWATALQILSLSNSANLAGGLSAPGGYNGMNPWAATSRPDLQSRDADRERERDYRRSPPYRRRSRSPSSWDRHRNLSPPRRRDSPVYEEYHRADSPVRRGEPRGRRGGGGSDYRQRSPPHPRRRRSPSPARKDPNLPPPGPKNVEWDYSIGQGNIKGSSYSPSHFW